MTEFETPALPLPEIDAFFERRSQAIDRLAALDYRIRTVGGEAIAAAYNAAERQVHAINADGEQRGWLSPQLID